MSDIYLHSIHQHPVKSCAPIELSRGWIDELGLSGDRRYMVADESGVFMTARKYPKLTQLMATPFDGGVILAAQGAPTLELHEADYLDDYRETEVWKQLMQAQHCGVEAQQWVSAFLDTPCQLLFFGEKTERPIKDFTEQQVSFADGYPLLLTSTASLDWLQERCPDFIAMQQFRPNLVASGNLPFAEDDWQEIQIGEVRFTVHSPCERCKLTTLPPHSIEFNPHQEPLRTMLKYRRAHEGGALFGQNLIAQNCGVIEAGMPIEVIKQAPADLIRDVE
ncbi:MOSC domain-containing protein [Neptunomonas qingdaonensis]|uniref:MOSC domain-containing protein n=1 Tax=Neptunomonas qingdaonensis TaxID=1045558 RepID=A0A1I2U024_9GAMM|nr:MOSC domain-containing protein [Neptunomonas qingdaonensis]SFG70424.1 hypothetical protein SAMN05216175_111116 [Neptunomonas qingdaonensis]